MSPNSYYSQYYDPGSLNVPGFGQSATNPLSPVFYDSMGIVKDLSVYNSAYVSKILDVGRILKLGSSFLSLSSFSVGVPSNFTQPSTFNQDVSLESNLSVSNLTSTGRLVVAGKEYRETTIVALNGAFTVLAQA